MNKKLRIWSLVGIFVIFAVATLWHFVFAWVPYDGLGLIFPVNESAWEHVKMFFFPALLFYVLQYAFVGKKHKNFIFAHGVSTIFMPVVMFAMFYGYRLLLGIEEKLIYDIIITFIAIALGSLVGYKITVSEKDHAKKGWSALVIVLVLFLVQGYFTFWPMENQLFYDKNVDQYGILDEYGDHDHDDEDHEGEDHDEDEHDQ